MCGIESGGDQSVKNELGLFLFKIKIIKENQNFGGFLFNYLTMRDSFLFYF
jgi:hypothetical protein